MMFDVLKSSDLTGQICLPRFQVDTHTLHSHSSESQFLDFSIPLTAQCHLRMKESHKKHQSNWIFFFLSCLHHSVGSGDISVVRALDS